ncbi:MAG: tetratricopeptide repeat protein [Bryobacter sp.]|nr:tetratricopeptide repeat protein [Bryobacter sp.]
MKNPLISLLVLLALGFVGCDSDPKVARQKYLETGNRYADTGKHRQAVIFYKRALQKDPRFGEAYYRKALSELKLGKPSDALRSLQRAVELSPENTDAATRLAELYLAAYAGSDRKPQSLIKEIEEISKKLLDKNPNSFEGLRLKGFIQLANKETAAALDSFLAADKAKPFQRELATVVYQTLISNNRAEEADAYARKMMEKDPTFEAMYDVVYAQFAAKDQIPQAEAILLKKFAALKDKPGAHLQLAAHYFASKQFDKMASTLDGVLKLGENAKQPHILVGDFYFKIRDFDRAIQQFEAGVKADARNKADYQKRIAETLVFMNKKTDAVRLVEEILKENPKDTEATAMRASLLLQGGSQEQVNSAVSDLTSAVSRSPQNHVLRLNLAKAHLAKGDMDQARIQLQEALKIRPDYTMAKIALSQIFLQRGEFSRSLDYANQILANDPNDIRGLLLRATSLYGSRDLSGARKDLETILARYPNLGDALYMMARVQLDSKQQAEAQQTFERMMQANPSDPRGLMGRVETLLQAGKGDDALRVIELALNSSPDRRDLRNAYANTAVRVGQYGKAIQEFQKLLASSPKDPSLVLRLAETYKRNGDDANAIKYFKQGSELLPGDPVGPLNHAMILDRQGKAAESRPIYEQVLKIDPGNVLALNNVAYILAETGQDLDLALTYAERAKQKVPQNTDISDTLGLIYIKKNLSDQAINIFLDLIKKDPNRALYHYHLAVAYYQKGDKPNAKKSASVALAKAPPKAEEAKIRDLLSKLS